MMWNKPWHLKEGFCIGSGLVLTGLLLQFTMGPVIWAAFAWPANLVALGLFLVLLGLATVLKEKVYFFKFSLSYAAAVPALCLAVVLTMIMGVTRQSNAPAEEDPLGISYCLTWWPFVLVYLWMAWIVGMTAIHQAVRILEGRHAGITNWTALVSHVGLFLVLVCGTLGSADMQRLKMYCEYHTPEWRALDNNNQTHELDLAIQLDSFLIDEYPPKLTLVANKTMTAVEVGGKPLSVLIDDKFQGTDMGDWRVTVGEVLDEAAPRMTQDSTTYVEWPVKGATCAVKVYAQNKKNPSHKVQGWVSCGSYSLPSEMLTLDSLYSIGMAQREPQRYASKIQVMSKDGDHVETVVEVNKPYTLMGWKIYQYSYNEQMGRWSNYSVFELVKDPWLPVVYVGIGCLLLGALGLFFGRRNPK